MVIMITALLAMAIPTTVASPDVLLQEKAIAVAFATRFHITTLPFTTPTPQVNINSTPMLSYFDVDADTVHEARFTELPDPVKAVFDRWAGYTSDEPSGNALFDDMFYRFFFVHEMGHWATFQMLDHRHDPAAQSAARNVIANHWQAELECNRISVAWWREKDPVYLAKLVGDFRKIVAALPSPVPPGQDMQTYFAANYEKLGQDPNVYGWFLLQSVVLAYDEPPRTFQQVIDRLPTETFAK